MNYEILHDLDRKLCFIGNTWHNRTQHAYWSQYRECEALSLEQALEQPQDWWNSRQFMCAVTNVAFKKRVVDAVSCFSPVWFSVINNTSVLGHDVTIGVNSWINCFNLISDGTEIGNHVTLTNYIQLSHDVQISDMCHVSGYSYMSFANLGQGCCTGLRTTIPAKPDSSVGVSPWTNLLMDSRLTHSINEPGTYFGNRKIDNETSLTKKIL